MKGEQLIHTFRTRTLSPQTQWVPAGGTTGGKKKSVAMVVKNLFSENICNPTRVASSLSTFLALSTEGLGRPSELSVLAYPVKGAH